MRASQQVHVVSRRLESEVVVLVLVDRFLCTCHIACVAWRCTRMSRGS